MASVSLTRQTVQESPRIVQVSFAGEVDAGIEDADRYFQDVLQSEQPKHILLDLTALTFASSPFFGSLLCWNREVSQRGGKLVLFGLCPEVTYVMHVCSLERLLTICPDQQAALAILGGSYTARGPE